MLRYSAEGEARVFRADFGAMEVSRVLGGNAAGETRGGFRNDLMTGYIGFGDASQPKFTRVEKPNLILRQDFCPVVGMSSSDVV